VGSRGQNVAIFELEMTRQAILMRWASAASQVDNRKIKRGICPGNASEKAAPYYASPEEWGRYMAALGGLSELATVVIDDTAGLTLSDIRLRSVQAASRLGGLDLVVVDHTDIIKSDPRQGENSAKTEGRKSREMHELAKELNCPVLLVQQLNRAVEGRTEKRPQLADLRDSGEHEQNADVVLALYRESYYKRQVPGSKTDLELEILGLKSREGPTAKAVIRYQRHLHLFTEFN
jgi:replicative DNA helicase